MFIKDDFDTVEVGVERLKEAVKLRNQMCGAMYYNIREENCCTIANKLLGMGADSSELNKIMGR